MFKCYNEFSIAISTIIECFECIYNCKINSLVCKINLLLCKINSLVCKTNSLVCNINSLMCKIISYVKQFKKRN